MRAGVVPVLYSYFDAAGAIDLEAHERQIAWVQQGGVAGITLFGLASEGGALSPAERRSLLAHTSSILPSGDALLVTVRPDDIVEELVRCALEFRDRLSLIFQIGQHAARSIAQFRALVAEPALAKHVDLGLQLAPGLIDTTFTADAIKDIEGLSDRLQFLKAEYNSIELAAHLSALDKPIDLLVGRHGQNLIEYLRIGAVGVIPGTEMAPALRPILEAWAAGRKDDATQAYGRIAAYVDFAMQDLDTVVDVGRAVTARALGFKPGPRRMPSGRDPKTMSAAIEAWWPHWQAINDPLPHPAR
jgi:4-hydroxy-tetrahydrodipicolinate synthase